MQARETSRTEGAVQDAAPLAIVLSGGGARAAYQVGFVRHLARRFPSLRVDILTGVSAGAFNAAFLACHTGTFVEKAHDLVRTWAGLTMDQVFRVDSPSLTSSVVRWGLRLATGGGGPPTRGLVDTSPLWDRLNESLGAVDGNLLGIDTNLQEGRLRSVAITGASYSTGQSVTWVQGEQMEPWDRPTRKSVRCNLRVAHVMASGALPLFFPAVQVEGRWYGDGGIRLSAPLSPALHLGARRILAVSTRYERSKQEAETPYVDGYPPPAQVLGVLLNAIFLDLVDQDAIRLERTNRVVREVDPARRQGLREVDLLVLRPSCDLGILANEHEADLPRSFRFLTRGLGTRETRSNDVLSLLMFQADYVQRLVDLGAADAESRRDEIGRFLGLSGRG
jgi:NTE family protein